MGEVVGFLAGLKHDQFAHAEPVDIASIADTVGRQFAVLADRNDELLKVDWLWPPEGFMPAQHTVCGALRICALSKARVFGPSLVVSDSGLLTSSTIYPGYVDAYAKGGHLANFCRDSIPPVDSSSAIDVDTAYAFLHFTRNTYGHYLIEMVSKLLVIRDLVIQGHDYPVIMSLNGWPFVREIAALVAPEVTFIKYDPRKNWIRARRLFVPSNTEDSGVFHFKHVVRRYYEVAERLAAQSSIERKSRLFIYRTKTSSFRYLLNWEELAAHAERHGFTALDPSELPWMDQVALFAGANYVVGELTSAFHNTVFSPQGCHTVPLNRVGSWQEGIAASRQHRLGYLLPDDGKTREYSLLASERQDFKIAPGTLDQRLDQILRD